MYQIQQQGSGVFQPVEHLFQAGGNVRAEKHLQIVRGAVEAEAVIFKAGGDISRAHDRLLECRHQAIEFRAPKAEIKEWRFEQVEQRFMGEMLFDAFQPARERRGRARGRKRPTCGILQFDVGPFQQGPYAPGKLAVVGDNADIVKSLQPPTAHLQIDRPGLRFGITGFMNDQTAARRTRGGLRFLFVRTLQQRACARGEGTIQKGRVGILRCSRQRACVHLAQQVCDRIFRAVISVFIPSLQQQNETVLGT